MSDKEILLSLIGSICLADHMGDVSNDVAKALEKIGMKDILTEIEEGDDFFSDLMGALHKRGVKTLYGTSLGDDL